MKPIDYEQDRMQEDEWRQQKIDLDASNLLTVLQLDNAAMQKYIREDLKSKHLYDHDCGKPMDVCVEERWLKIFDDFYA